LDIFNIERFESIESFDILSSHFTLVRSDFTMVRSDVLNLMNLLWLQIRF